MITFWIILAIYLVLGLAIDWHLRRDGMLMKTQPRICGAILLPIAMVGLFAWSLMRSSNPKWWRPQFPAERLWRFIVRSRRRQWKLMEQVRQAERDLRREEKYHKQTRDEIEQTSTWKAGNILNTRWLEATVAARDAMAKVLDPKRDEKKATEAAPEPVEE